jgi:hypothetical protein
VALSDGSTAGADLRIHTIDGFFPSAATIQVSADGVAFVTLGAPPLNDPGRTCLGDSTKFCNYDDNASGFIDLDLDAAGLSFLTHVRLTDLHGSIDGETTAPLAGFDLDAIEALHPADRVNIDIKPGSSPNSIHPRNRGTTPVAILSSSTFDAPSQVDMSSLAFGRTGNEMSLAFCNPSPNDVNFDGLLDQVCHFTSQLTGFLPGDTVGVLKGKTATSISIIGTDSVRIVP